MIGSTLDSFTTPQPICVHGATGDTGVVPESGSQVLNEGYLVAFVALVALAPEPRGLVARETPRRRVVHAIVVELARRRREIAMIFEELRHRDPRCAMLLAEVSLEVKATSALGPTTWTMGRGRR